MARSRKRSKTAAPAPAPAAEPRSSHAGAKASAGQAPAAPEPRLLSKRIWLGVLAVAVTWWLFLLLTAWLTANPVTLNHRQIVEAHYVVTGKVTNLAQGTVDVTREWKHAARLKTVTVENMNQTVAQEWETYLIPLDAVGKDAYRVAETPIEGAPPAIYPVTAEAIAQLEAIMEELAQRDESR